MEHLYTGNKIQRGTRLSFFRKLSLKGFKLDVQFLNVFKCPPSLPPSQRLHVNLVHVAQSKVRGNSCNHNMRDV